MNTKEISWNDFSRETKYICETGESFDSRWFIERVIIVQDAEGRYWEGVKCTDTNDGENAAYENQQLQEWVEVEPYEKTIKAWRAKTHADSTTINTVS